MRPLNFRVNDHLEVPTRVALMQRVPAEQPRNLWERGGVAGVQTHVRPLVNESWRPSQATHRRYTRIRFTMVELYTLQFHTTECTFAIRSSFLTGGMLPHQRGHLL